MKRQIIAFLFLALCFISMGMLAQKLPAIKAKVVVSQDLIQSKCLSDFSGHPRYLKSSVLLPSGYFDHPEKTYPICYGAPGLNGGYTKVNALICNKDPLPENVPG